MSFHANCHSITRGRVTLEFIILFWQIILGVIKPTSIVAGVGIVTNAIIEPIFRITLNILASIRAIELVVVDGVIHQVRVVASLKNLHRTGTVSEEAKIHQCSPFDCAIVNTDHLDGEFGVSLAPQFKLICGGIQFVLYACVKEVKIGLILKVPGAKKAEEVSESGER